MKKVLFLILTLTVIGILIVSSFPSDKSLIKNFRQKKDLQELKEHLLASELNSTEEHKAILTRLNQLNISYHGCNKEGSKNLSSIGENGKWLDIDFEVEGRTKWKPITHLERLKTIAICYRDSTSEIYLDKKAILAIENGLGVWLEENPICKNWWFNDIAVPKALVTILALVNEDISRDIKSGILALLETRPIEKNKLASNVHSYYYQIIRGCILGNDSIITEAVNKFFTPLRTSGPEDIQTDMSYLKHGPQFHNGSYGGEFIVRYVEMIWLLKGSKYEPSQDKINLLCQFISEGYLPLFRGEYIDFSSTGRAITRKNYLYRNKSLEYVYKLMDYDTIHNQQYEELYANLSKSLNQTKNINFSKSGFMLHKRPSYDFSVRCVSKNLAHTETMNGENLYGTYLADGATNIRIDGDEYYNIAPVWEWDLIPGTTSPKGELTNFHDSKDLGENCKFALVSDNKYGIMCYEMNDYGISANKTWFMLDDAIICLGSSITGNSDIHTSVNQCLLDGEVYIGETNLKYNKTLEHEFKGWIWHDNIGYYFPKEQNIRLKVGNQTGSWNKINKSEAADIVSKPVFNLSIDHGNNPKNASYEYFIVPGISNMFNTQEFDPASIIVIANDQNNSAIYDIKSDILCIVFWQSGTFVYNDIPFVKDNPGVVMVLGSKNSDESKILVSDFE